MLTIVEASDQMFWYLARNSQGQTGLVPVTFIDKVKLLLLCGQSIEIRFPLLM